MSTMINKTLAEAFRVAENEGQTLADSIRGLLEQVKVDEAAIHNKVTEISKNTRTYANESEKLIKGFENDVVKARGLNVVDSMEKRERVQEQLQDSIDGGKPSSPGSERQKS